MNKWHILITLLLITSCGIPSAESLSDRPYLRLSIKEKSVGASSGEFELQIKTNTSWSSESPDWINVTPASGKGNATVIISYDALAYGDRTGEVRVNVAKLEPAALILTQARRTFKNPISQPLPDPYVWRESDGNSSTYYLCKSGGSTISLGASDKLTVLGATSVVWRCPADGIYKVWNNSNLWAPELHKIDGVWYIYYAAGRPTTETDGSYHTQRTGVLRCKDSDPITGKWEDMGMIFTGDEEGYTDYSQSKIATADNTIYAIDMTVFKLKKQLYAIWSGNVSATDENQRLYIATMDNPWTINCPRVEISKAELAWETANRSINEGPSILINPDGTKLFCVYSANGSWTPEYKLGYLALDMSEDPMQPSNWEKSSDAVFWRCDNVYKSSNPNNGDPKNQATIHIGGVHGVGHNCFTKSYDGTEDWIMYHTKRYMDSGWDNRDCFIQKFTWKANGTPDFGTPVGWQEELDTPSGEPR